MAVGSKLLFSSLLVLVIISNSIVLTNAANDNVTTLLNETEELSTTAYTAVVEAKQAGANVSTLIDELNIAGEYLAEAYALNRLGFSESAVNYVNLCQNIVNTVKQQADELRDEAKTSTENDLMVTVIGSGAGVVVVIAVCSFSWHIFKRNKYRTRISKKLEVNKR